MDWILKHKTVPPNSVDLSFCLFEFMNIDYNTNNLRPLALYGWAHKRKDQSCISNSFMTVKNYVMIIFLFPKTIPDIGFKI